MAFSGGGREPWILLLFGDEDSMPFGPGILHHGA
jgi:hypothetical protein